jgi:hemerythrin
MTHFVEWSKDLSVGIEEIDAQHRVLVDLLNEMHDAIQERRGSAVVNDVLAKLAEYTRIHFAVEESLMRIFHYPDYEAHKAEHEELIASAKALQQKLLHEGRMVVGEDLQFLEHWLTGHILGTDKDLGAYLCERM